MYQALLYAPECATVFWVCRIVVTTHELGKNLSNPRMNFVIHFDIVGNEVMKMHEEQVSRASANRIL